MTNPFAVQLCKRTIFAGVIVTILSFLVSCHTLPLKATDDQIRAQILTVTPLGMALQDAGPLIRQRIHPDSFHLDKNLPELATGGTPPVERCTVIACDLGRTHGWPLPFLAATYTQVEAHWIFDSTGHLVAVEVARNPRGM